MRLIALCHAASTAGTPVPVAGEGRLPRAAFPPDSVAKAVAERVPEAATIARAAIDRAPVAPP